MCHNPVSPNDKKLQKHTIIYAHFIKGTSWAAVRPETQDTETKEVISVFSFAFTLVVINHHSSWLIILESFSLVIRDDIEKDRKEPLHRRRRRLK